MTILGKLALTDGLVFSVCLVLLPYWATEWENYGWRRASPVARTLARLMFITIGIGFLFALLAIWGVR